MQSGSILYISLFRTVLKGVGRVHRCSGGAELSGDWLVGGASARRQCLLVKGLMWWLSVAPCGWREPGQLRGLSPLRGSAARVRSAVDGILGVHVVDDSVGGAAPGSSLLAEVRPLARHAVEPRAASVDSIAAALSGV
jgi:hypothetical protein